MKAVRLTRANGLNERVQGDAGAIRFLEDAEAGDMVRRLLAVYAPEHDPHPSFTAGGAQEIPVVKKENAPTPDEVLDAADVSFAGPEHAAKRMQKLVDYTEELGLYENQQQAQDDGFSTERTGQGETAEMKQPWTIAPKADWIAWAVQNGEDPQKAAAMKKVDLVSRYGERL
jgi:hypothetical protein